jgi:hypothetical protein
LGIVIPPELLFFFKITLPNMGLLCIYIYVCACVYVWYMSYVYIVLLLFLFSFIWRLSIEIWDYIDYLDSFCQYGHFHSINSANLWTRAVYLSSNILFNLFLLCFIIFIIKFLLRYFYLIYIYISLFCLFYFLWTIVNRNFPCFSSP